MTNFSDEYRVRVGTDGAGLGKEVTEGVPREGFADPSGEFPKREYFYDTSINKAATGEVVNRLSIGGGDVGVDLDLPDQEPSIFPFNQIQETPSGHSFEMDDTPGGERVLIKHRTGAGIELRADGSVLISTRKQRVEVVGGDSKVIVEGEGDLVYKGNVDLRIDGDFNVSVGGDYNIDVAGDKKEEIKGRHTKTVNRDQNHTIRGNRLTDVVGFSSDTVLNNRKVITKGYHHIWTEGDTEILTSNNLLTTAVNQWVCTASTTSMSARSMSVIGQKGVFGGPNHDYYGNTYGGRPAGKTNRSTFYGFLEGKAREAIHSEYAMDANEAQFADKAAEAAIAGKTGAVTIVNEEPVNYQYEFSTLEPIIELPTADNIELLVSTSNVGVREVAIDPEFPNKLKRSDEYKELFSHDPSIHEIRSKLRDRANHDNDEFTGFLVGEGKLNSSFKKNLPTNIGRSASKKGTIRFGSELLGNNPADNRSKRFKVNTK